MDNQNYLVVSCIARVELRLPMPNEFNQVQKKTFNKYFD